MRKALSWLVGLVVVGGVAMSGFWWIFAPQAKAQIDAALQQARSHGVDTSYGELTIAGFPFAFEGRFTDLSISSRRDGLTAAFPDASGWVSPLEPNAVNLIFPETFTVTQFAGETAMAVDVASRGMTAKLVRADGDAFSYEVLADMLRVSPAGAVRADHLEYEQPRLTGRLARGAGGVPTALDVAFSATRFTGALALETGDGAVSEATIGADGVTGTIDASEAAFDLGLAATTVLLEVDGLDDSRSEFSDMAASVAIRPKTPLNAAAFLAERSDGGALERVASLLATAALDGGAADLETSWSGYQVDVALGDPEAPIDGVSFIGEAGASSLAILGDVATIEARNGPFRMTSRGGPIAYEGSVAASVAEIIYPLRADPDAVQPASVSYALSDLGLSGATWTALDPAGTLPREIPGLRLDADFGLIVIEDFISIAAAPIPESGTAELAIELADVDLEALTIEALGFSGRATGQAARAPGGFDGEFLIELENWRDTIANVTAAGLVDDASALVAATVLDTMARRVDETRSEILVELRGDQILVNGSPIGGPAR